MNSLYAKNEYRQLCSLGSTIPIFSKDWWLDVVCGPEKWNVAIVKNSDQIIASLPYYLTRKWGNNVIRMPALTQTMGPWIKYPEGQKYTNRLSFEKQVMTELIENLPPVSYFSQNFHYSITNWLPFYWRGYKQTTRYTYVIDDLSDLNRVFQEFKSNARGKIRKAGKLVEITVNGTLEDFYHINKKTFERQKLAIPYSLEFVQRMDKALRKHKAREIFFAIDANGRYHSALYLIWDEQSSYVHMVGEDYNLRSSGAGILLIWEAIKFTKEKLSLNRFDFEGSMIEPIEETRRSFGARQVPYFTISKDQRNYFIKAVMGVRPMAGRLARKLGFRR